MALFIEHPPGTAVGYQKLTVDATAGGVSFTIPAHAGPQADAALVTVETQPARYKLLGADSAPTTTDGHLVDNGDAFTLWGADTLAAFRAIRTTGSSSTFHVTFYRTQRI